MHSEKYVSFIISNPQMKFATSMINGNAFPSSSQTEVIAAARRLAIFNYHVDAMPLEIDKAKEAFFTYLSRNWQKSFIQFTTRKNPEFVAFPDGLPYISCTHSILYEMKAFLDIFTRLLCPLVSSVAGPHGFNKAKIDSENLAGGKLINWLSKRTLTELPQRDELVTLLTKASHSWITTAVYRRDTLGHYRDLPGFNHMRVLLSQVNNFPSRSDIHPPKMPDGEELTKYVFRLRTQLCSLVSDVLPLIPSVKTELLESWESAEHHLHINA